MLHSEAPRTLVYKDIEVISDVLGSSSKPTIEREFYNRLVNRPFMKDVSNAYRCVLTVFNNAFYISTLIIFDDGSSLSTNIYMNKAAEGVDDVELKPHIVAATMALVYNWLGIYVHENDLASFESKDIPLLKKNISKYFEEENSDVTSEGKKDFNSLVIVDSALNKGLDDSFFVLRDMKDIVNSTDIPIQDVVKGIGYILECYGAYFNNNSERRDFMSRILERIDDEKMLVDDTLLLNSAKKKIKSERKRLKYAPEDEAPSYLSLDNLQKVPASCDGILKGLVCTEKVEIVIPEELRTEQAKALLTKFKDIGWLDDNFQPTSSLSYTEIPLLAHRLAVNLNIKNLWKVFGIFWGRKPGSLRAIYNRAMNQEKSSDFLGKLNTLLK